MIKWFKRILKLIKETGKDFSKKNPLLLGAAISFYIILSLGPILVITIFGIGSLFGEKAVEGQILEEIQTIVGKKPAEVIQSVIQKAYKLPSKTITLLSSIPLLFFGGTMIFYQLRIAINLMWEIEDNEPSGIKNKLKNYSFSILMLFIVGILIMLLVIKSPALFMVRDFLDEIISFPIFLVDILDLLSNIIIITLLFGLIYRILPAIDIKWSDVWVGAGATSILFVLVQFLVSLNVSNTNIESASGAIGSFTILILWIFYSSLIFLFGANFTKMYAKRYGSFKEMNNR